MKSIINISFNSLVERLLPPSKRTLNNLSFIIGLTSQVVYNYLLFRFDFLEGSSYAQWDELTNYVKNDRVTYKFRTYEAKADNVGRIPETTEQWRLLNESTIGLESQARYSAQRLSFEGYLNEWYGITSAPFIYIENNASKANPLYVYNESENIPTYFYNASESVAFNLGDPYLTGDLVTDGSGVYYICIADNTNEPLSNEIYWSVYNYSTNESELISGNDFTVFVPIAVYNTLGVNDAQRDANVQSQVDKYRIYGTNNTIETY